MVENTSGPYQKHKNNSDDNNMEIEDEDIGIEEDVGNEEDYPESEEFQAIDNQLNMINSVLDNLEEKSDTIIAELATLLRESQEIRMQIQQNQMEGDDGSAENN